MCRNHTGCACARRTERARATRTKDLVSTPCLKRESQRLRARRYSPHTPIWRSFTPKRWNYRLKRILLGKPLVSEQLSGERLNRPIALGVLAPDCISSSAYGTEEILTQMTPYVGLAAFALVVPIMFVIIGVLLFVTISYLGRHQVLHDGRRILRRGARQLRPQGGPRSRPSPCSSTTPSPSRCSARRAPRHSRRPFLNSPSTFRSLATAPFP